MKFLSKGFLRGLKNKKEKAEYAILKNLPSARLLTNRKRK